MSRKLCIIIKSDYSLNGSQSQNQDQIHHWLEEVRTDSETVKETLSDHEFLEISIPVLAKPRAITAIVAQEMAKISPEYESCHIVLNTHGAAGASDLADEAVKQVVQSLSSVGIAVSRLSALQCNGMSALSSEEQRAADRMRPAHSTARGKDASMSILQQKLNHMIAAIPQTFAICGFESAYDPKIERESVVAVLRGEGPSLQVQTIAQSSLDINLEQIVASIVVVKYTPADKRINNLAYDRATNLLGVVLEGMKNNIRTCLKSATTPNPENLLLFEKLKEFALNQNKDRPLSDANLDRIYKSWAKDNRIRSESRLEVLQNYCTCLGPSVLNATAAAKSSLDARDARRPESLSLGIRTLGVFSQEKRPSDKEVQAQDVTPATPSRPSSP